MNNHIRFSPRASLAMTGICIQQMGIWQMVSEHVTVKQKVMVHTPMEKLGSLGIQGVHPDVGIK